MLLLSMFNGNIIIYYTNIFVKFLSKSVKIGIFLLFFTVMLTKA